MLFSVREQLIIHSVGADTWPMHHEGQSLRHAQQGLRQSGRQSPAIQQGQLAQGHAFSFCAVYLIYYLSDVFLKYCKALHGATFIDVL